MKHSRETAPPPPGRNLPGETASPPASRTGWIFYDGQCRLCLSLVSRFSAPLEKKGYQFAPLEAPWVRELLGLKEGEPPKEMAVATPAGEILGGADAVIHLARSFAWLRPLAVLLRLPGLLHFSRFLYRKVAAHRHCAGGACPMPAPPGSHDPAAARVRPRQTC